MTVRELLGYLTECDDSGFGQADILVCDCCDNPITDAICVVHALRIEEKDGEKCVVLQTG